MKKFLCKALTVATIAGSMVLPVSAQTNISVTLNGNYLHFDQPPIMRNDRTLVPMRAIFESLGAEVSWNNNTETVTAVKGNIILKLTIGEKAIYKNGKKISLDVEPILLNDRTLVPVRAISESIGANVSWNESTNTVIINYSNTNTTNCKHRKTTSKVDEYYDVNINDNNPQTHILRRKLETVCKNCDITLKTENQDYRVEHEFKNGTCTLCGYVKNSSGSYNDDVFDDNTNTDDNYENDYNNNYNNDYDYSDNSSNSASNNNNESKNDSVHDSMLPLGVLGDYIDGAFMYINVPAGKSIEIPNRGSGSLKITINGTSNIMKIKQNGKIETLSYNDKNKKRNTTLYKMEKAIIQNSGSEDMVVSIPAEYANYSETSQKVYETMYINAGESVELSGIQDNSIEISKDGKWEFIRYYPKKQDLYMAKVSYDSSAKYVSEKTINIITAKNDLEVYYCPLTTKCSKTSQSAFKEIAVGSGQTIRVRAADTSNTVIYPTNDTYKYDYVSYKKDGKISSQKQDRKNEKISIPKGGFADFTNKSDTTVTIKIPSVYCSVN